MTEDECVHLHDVRSRVRGALADAPQALDTWRRVVGRLCLLGAHPQQTHHLVRPVWKHHRTFSTPVALQGQAIAPHKMLVSLQAFDARPLVSASYTRAHAATLRHAFWLSLGRLPKNRLAPRERAQQHRGGSRRSTPRHSLLYIFGPVTDLIRTKKFLSAM
jgi:hypothetical protein